MKPKVAILFAEGTNFDEETKYAFEKSGARTEILPMKLVLEKKDLLLDYQIIDIPGGFSYGDDLLAGKIWANQIRIYLWDTIQKFLKKGGIIIGVCNGFQVLVRSGLLPGFGKSHETVGLIYNEKQKFECRWINFKMIKNRCVFLQNKEIITGNLTVEHGEGRFITANSRVLKILKENSQIVFQYTNHAYHDTMGYPDNPNGSTSAIAGICDHTGQVLGMMPHPEHHIEYWQRPNWRREKVLDIPFGLKIYKAAVNFCQKN